MLEEHKAEILFADLDPEQQEKSIRNAEVYAEMTYLNREKYDYGRIFGEFDDPTCGCNLPNFEKQTKRMKMKLLYGHMAVADHLPSKQCDKCGVHMDQNLVNVHQYFKCDDKEAKREFIREPNQEIFKIWIVWREIAKSELDQNEPW